MSDPSIPVQNATDDFRPVAAQVSPDDSQVGPALSSAASLYPAPAGLIPRLLVAGVLLGSVGDVLFRAPGPVGLNVSLWMLALAVAALALHRSAALDLDRRRIAWLFIGVAFAAGATWRDARPMKLLGLGCAALTFALAAHRSSAGWVRVASALQHARALILGALHTSVSATFVLSDVKRSLSIPTRREGEWRRATAIGRGLLLATPLVAVFGGLFMSADAVFTELILEAVRFDFASIAGHILLCGVIAWLSTGYLHAFLTGTDPAGRDAVEPQSPTLGSTEVLTALAALDLLFLLFVMVQFRYLFGGELLIQVTPELTYSEYARRGFFELVIAVVLVVPVLLVADWILDRRSQRDIGMFRSLAGVQIGLVLAIALSALQRLRLYHASYGLTESRFYAMVLLIWIGAVLCWFAATVLRGHRDSFAFGGLISGFVTIAFLFGANPDAVIASANLKRIPSANGALGYDVAYATTLSADAATVLIDALPGLPRHLQCPLASQLLRRWPPDHDIPIRNWNWSVSRAAHAVRNQEAQLRQMAAPEGCVAFGSK